ncbi:LuxR C-terminal-related transcriptional regulator [Actinokineospora sp. PR83]|uniref:ATP-binding protein n=1 Tax=Actinokineospora sp. PR83 TaxID=2884908 RepID=UPI0027E077F4|nr:LuxR C-terminal-related transcriptional regulator [Actinokineospora sp. PR83]MCG8920644.1 LuxR C-terminal-related transcriptional regulator [Actinokineospora sp. PR83]
MDGDPLPPESAGFADRWGLSSHVGRTAEIAEGARLLATRRLVTLTGPGGVGKSRLADRVAAHVADRFPDGRAVVELAGLREPAMVAEVVAHQLIQHDRSPRPALEVVVDHLRDKALLLVLDNCEHLVGACADLVRALAQGCPRVAVLATSRQSLGVDGERVLPVPPLAVPGEGPLPVTALVEVDAVRLFVDRAQAVVPAFAVTEDNAADVAEVCRRLEGLPLAIELAAVRIRALSAGQLAERLTRSLPTLTAGSRTAPQRQHTLRATIDWSHGLCSPSERRVWARASVFSGTFDLDAAEHVCAGPDGGGGPDDVLAAIDGLLDKSVLTREEHDGVARYRMSGAVREYGAERLESAGERAAVARLHRDWFAVVADRFAAAWLGPDQLTWVRRLWRDQPNFRVATEYCVSTPGESVVAVRMGLAMMHHWTLHGLLSEARMWMDRTLPGIPDDAPERGTALWLAGLSALGQTDVPAAATHLTAAGEVAKQHGDRVLRARVASTWGIASVYGGELAAARTLLDKALAVFRTRDDLVSDRLFALVFAAQALGLSGDTEGAKALLAEGTALSRACGEHYFRGWLLYAKARVSLAEGDWAEAESTGRQALRAQWDLGNRFTAAFTAELLATAAAKGGSPEQAAFLFGVAGGIWALMGSNPGAYPAIGTTHTTEVEALRAELGPTRYDQAYARGLRTSPTAALQPAPTATPRGTLTKRELEIAALVAEGLTNRDIAERLVIARRTAESHVDHILRKLNLTNRSQIAAWISTRP